MARFEAKKFTGKNDFGLWRIKMKALLVQQGLADALKSENDLEKEVVPDEKTVMRNRKSVIELTAPLCYP